MRELVRVKTVHPPCLQLREKQLQDCSGYNNSASDSPRENFCVQIFTTESRGGKEEVGGMSSEGQIHVECRWRKLSVLNWTGEWRNWNRRCSGKVAKLCKYLECDLILRRDMARNDFLSNKDTTGTDYDAWNQLQAEGKWGGWFILLLLYIPS